MEHFSWYQLFPGYAALHAYLQTHFSTTVLFNGGILPKDPTFQTVHHLFAAFLVLGILVTLSLLVRTHVQDLDKALIPEKRITLTNLVELLLQSLMSVMRDIIGQDYKRHVPFVGTLCLFILVSNLLGLIPGFIPPTDNLNTTLACGLSVFVYFNLQGLRVHGIHHILHLANPLGVWWGWFLMPLMLPVELIGLLVRPFSLAIRLAANMIGDHKVLFAFAGLMPFLLPIPFLLLGLLVAVIQTTVFCFLTCVYISLHTQETEH